MLIDNFEQHFESCVLEQTKSLEKPSKSDKHSFNILKNELMKIFRSLCLFKYALAKNENPKMPVINRKLSKLENTHS